MTTAVKTYAKIERVSTDIEGVARKGALILPVGEDMWTHIHGSNAYIFERHREELCLPVVDSLLEILYPNGESCDTSDIEDATIVRRRSDTNSVVIYPLVEFYLRHPLILPLHHIAADQVNSLRIKMSRVLSMGSERSPLFAIPLGELELITLGADVGSEISVVERNDKIIEAEEPLPGEIRQYTFILERPPFYEKLFGKISALVGYGQS